jgi:hypothetical protein
MKQHLFFKLGAWWSISAHGCLYRLYGYPDNPFVHYSVMAGRPEKQHLRSYGMVRQMQISGKFS